MIRVYISKSTLTGFSKRFDVGYERQKCVNGSVIPVASRPGRMELAFTRLGENVGETDLGRKTGGTVLSFLDLRYLLGMQEM